MNYDTFMGMGLGVICSAPIVALFWGASTRQLRNELADWRREALHFEKAWKAALADTYDRWVYSPATDVQAVINEAASRLPYGSRDNVVTLRNGDSITSKPETDTVVCGGCGMGVLPIELEACSGRDCPHYQAAKLRGDFQGELALSDGNPNDVSAVENFPVGSNNFLRGRTPSV